MKVIRTLLFTGTLSILFLAAATLVSADDRKQFTVGMILPLTGPAADYGQALVNSMEVAKSDRPELFTKVRLVAEDGLYDARTSVAAFKKLHDIDKVDLVVTWGVIFCKAIAPVAESTKTVFVGICIDPEIGKGNNYVTRFMNYTDQYMQATVKYLYEKRLNNLGVILADNPYQEEMFNALKRSLLPGQTATLVDRVTATQSNFRSHIPKLKTQKFDAIGSFLMMGQIAQFAKQMREQHLSLPVFGNNAFESMNEIKAAEGAMEGSVFANTEIKPEFLKRYRARYGTVTHLAFGAPAYEFTTLLGEIVNAHSSIPTPDEVLDSFTKIGTRPGVAAGPYTFTNHPEVGKFFNFPVVMKQVLGDGFEVIKN